jgi:hypothetical protein
LPSDAGSAGDVAGGDDVDVRAPAALDILCVAGPVRRRDRTGHHDYVAGARLLADLLCRDSRVRAHVVEEGWPRDDGAIDRAAAVVVYDRGGGNQGFLAGSERIGRMRRLVENGLGIVLIHQAVAFPREHAELSRAWLGGAYASGASQRGHWRSRHEQFPEHPVTRGVAPWTIRDGWLRGIRFGESPHGLTPVVWSGKQHRGSSAGGTDDVVAWAYERPDGGRSFCFTGLDAHSAWSAAGVRRLIVNAALWSGGLAVPEAGAACEVSAAVLKGYLTPRQSPVRAPLDLARKLARKAMGRRRRW